MCDNTHDCPCVKAECPRHGKCCECIAAHNAAGSLTACVKLAQANA